MSRFLLVAFFAIIPAQAKAQELFGGYQLMYDTFLRYETSHATTPLGWTVDLTGKPTPWFGLVGQASGSYSRLNIPNAVKVVDHIHMLLGGARFGGYTANRSFVFGQILVGGLHRHQYPTDPNYCCSVLRWGDQWVISAGGGGDVRRSDRLSIRFAADWLHAFHHDTASLYTIAYPVNTIRGQIGLVFRLRTHP